MTSPSSSAPLVIDVQQQEAIHAPSRPLRINAGAGSGKTTVMAHRVRAFVERGYRPDQILGLTFSNKAAENLRRRIAEEVGGGLDVTVATYHGFGASIVSNYALELGFTSAPKLIDRANAFGLLYDALNEVTLDTRKVGRVANLVAAAIRLASQCADHLVSLEAVIADCERIEADRTIAPEAVKGASGRKDLARLALVFAHAKRRHNAIDFGDQISLAVRVLESNTLRCEELLDRHPIVLLDEYQDTNYAQRRLLQSIYPAGSPVTVVGDDMQSIYAFRGAHIQNILDFPNHFALPRTETEQFDTVAVVEGDLVGGHVEATLTTNYRSGPRIVAVANSIADRVANSLPKVLQPRTSADPDTIEAVVGQDDVDEASRIADWVAARGAPWSQTVVLGRKRKIFPAIAEAIAARGIPVEIVGIGGLLLRPEVVDVDAWLELLALDSPNVAVLRLLRSPLRNIGLNDLAVLSQHASKLARAAAPDVAHPPLDLLAALDDLDSVAHLSPEAWTRLKAFQADSRFIRRRSAECSLVELLDVIIDMERLFDRVDDIGAENLLRFLDVADQFSPLTGPPSVASFVQYLSLIADSEDEPSEASATDSNSVRIMSIHQAKGLEFDNVVLAGLSGSKSSRIFPDDRLAENGVTQTEVLPLWLRTDNDGFIEPPRTKLQVAAFKERAIRMRTDEELRLLYVAVTRAKKQLFCTAAQWYPGAAEPQGVSTFYTLLCSLSEQVTEHLPRVEPSGENPEIARRRRRVAAAIEAEESRRSTDTEMPKSSRPGTIRGRRTPAQQSSLLEGFGATSAAGSAPSGADHIERISTISATELASLERCPQQYLWSSVHRLPRPHRRSAAFGTTVHSEIEAHFANRMTTRATSPGIAGDDDYVAEENPDEPVLDDPGGHHIASTEQLVAAVAASPWSSATVLGVETAFDLDLFEADSAWQTRIRGRIDAVFAVDDLVHVVDWKTGQPPAVVDPGARTQLDVYGLVASRLWGYDPERIRVSYVYIQQNSVVNDTMVWSERYGAEVLQRLRDIIGKAQSSRASARSGPWCRRCDFRAICPSASVNV